MLKNRNVGNTETFEVMSNIFQILKTHMKEGWNKYWILYLSSSWNLLLIGCFCFLVTDIHTVTVETKLVILVYLLCRVRKSSNREASIERNAKIREEVLQKKVKQLEDQLQEVTQKHKEQSESEARRLKVCSIVALLWW